MWRYPYIGVQKLRGRIALLLQSKQWRAVLGITLLLFVSLPLTLLVRDAQALPCSCTLFTSDPTVNNFNNGSPIELGVKIIPSVNGSIKGVRFYKGPTASMGTDHNATLWTSGGVSLATGSITGNAATGWTDITFSSPVSVTAGTTYVASVTMLNNRYVASANYFTSNVVNGPLTAPSSASSGGNGVFHTTGGSFPQTSFNSTNYWIDVSFYDETAPAVSSVTPLDDAIDVQPGETVTATFDQTMDSTTISGSTFTVKDEQNNAVAGTVSYNNSTKTASFVATNGFAVGTTYIATVEGGSGTVAKNGIGIALASDYIWSFTISSTNSCPCSLKDRIGPESSTTVDDSGGLEVGVKIKASTNGYITALRFYKPIISTETTHTGKIWSSTGSQLASVSFTNETDYGWQEARLSSPLQVTENTQYIISYGTTTAVYQATVGGLNSNITDGYLTAYADNSSENANTSSGNRNGVFTLTAGNYPATGSTNGSYYWIDAVFATEPTPTYPLEIIDTQPVANSFGQQRDDAVTATFNRTLDSATVTNSTFRLFDSASGQVSGTGTYNSGKGMATFTPTSPLTYGERYTATLSASISDPNGTTLGSDYSWSFTVGSEVATTLNEGPGGPVLVVTTSTNKYSPYYAEILRAEGFNLFAVEDITAVNSTTLSAYDTVIVSEMTLSQSQADMFSAWVTDGGNLIAMRPDNKLASLLGLTSAGTTRTNQYLLINTLTTPGNGLVDETIQYKGTADNYTLDGATAVATFYSDASTATSNPAVTTRSVGSNGGTAVAFSYDLAKSVVAQHQGNQAWAGQNRDGLSVTRPNDLFYGAMVGDVQPDWVDLNKIHIPQADEQQRLLANIMIEVTKDRKPLPRFWYLPNNYEAAMVMAGDDHGLSNAVGTERILNNWLNKSATDCSVSDWECVRASHYTYESASLTNTRALQYHNLDFEIGDHVANGCVNFASHASLTAEYTSNLATWRAKYTSIPNQVSHRFHCYVWSNWDSQPIVEYANNIRYDLNYLAFPGAWIGTRAPIITGSGMNMRLTDADGDMLDVRQGVSNVDDQAANAVNIDALLDNALGADGYYGVFGSHYDMSNPFDVTLYTSASARNVPMISSVQALTWFDGRESSTFTNMTGSNGLFGFTITAAEGAHGLKAMMPIQDAGGTLSTLTLGGSTVSYDTRTVKGVQYAVFSAAPGTYSATYSDYDPNAGGGGGGGGGGSSGGSDSGNSPTTTTKKKTTTTTSEEETTAEDTPPSSTEQTQELPKKELVTPSDSTQDTDTPWLLWALAGFIAGGIIWWIIFTIRRRNRPTY